MKSDFLNLSLAQKKKKKTFFSLLYKFHTNTVPDKALGLRSAPIKYFDKYLKDASVCYSYGGTFYMPLFCFH